MMRCCRWADRVLAEFFAQGDQERAAGQPISPLCDRETTKRPASQINFIEFIVAPLFAIVARIFPDIGEIMDNTVATRYFWQALLLAEIESDASIPSQEERRNHTEKAEHRMNAFKEKYKDVLSLSAKRRRDIRRKLSLIPLTGTASTTSWSSVSSAPAMHGAAMNTTAAAPPAAALSPPYAHSSISSSTATLYNTHQNSVHATLTGTSAVPLSNDSIQQKHRKASIPFVPVNNASNSPRVSASRTSTASMLSSQCNSPVTDNGTPTARRLSSFSSSHNDLAKMVASTMFARRNSNGKSFQGSESMDKVPLAKRAGDDQEQHHAIDIPDADRMQDGDGGMV